MIQSVWVEIPGGNRLTLDLRKSGNEIGLYIFNLDGLGPPKSTVHGAGGVGFDGIRVNSVSVDARHMILTVATDKTGLDEETVKAYIYRYFPTKEYVRFGIKTDMADVYIDALVESVESSQFSKIENYVISLTCPQPYFYDVSSRSTRMYGGRAIPNFEFPFSNESLSYPLIVFGTVSDLPRAELFYNGGMPAGCVLDIWFSGRAQYLVFTNNNGNQRMSIDLAVAETLMDDEIAAGDRIQIVTMPGEKSAWFFRGDDWYNIINAIAIRDDWLEIRSGPNDIIFTATSGVLNVETDLTFIPLWAGV